MTILEPVYLQDNGQLLPIAWDAQPTGERVYLDSLLSMTTERQPDLLYSDPDGRYEARPARGRRVFMHMAKARGRLEVVEVYEASDIPVADGHVVFRGYQDGEYLLPWEPTEVR